MIGSDFILAGKAMFTLEIPAAYAAEKRTPAHLTFRVNSKTNERGTVYFVSLLTGPDRETDFRYLGIIDAATGGIRLTKASLTGADSLTYKLADRAFRRVFAGEGDALLAAGFELHHEGACGRCGRPLTRPDSIRSGFGPECIAKIMGA